jgi:flagellar hook-associated protein 1 FlgK
MGMNVMGVGISSLNATLVGIRTTQHNIANASTPGYHRQEVRQSSSMPEFLGGSWLGTGVEATNVVRMYSSFLDNELRTYEGKLSGSEAYAFYAGQVDSLLGDSTNNLDKVMQKFFVGVNEVANNPTSMAAREQMLTQGKNLAGRMQLLGGRMEALGGYVNQEVDTVVQQINAYVKRIAELNAAIGYGGTMSQAPNDLNDQRDQLVNELNKLVNVNQVQQSDGSIGVFMSNGQPLVVGSTTQTLLSINDPEDYSQRTLALRATNNSLVYMNNSEISDGRLGGLLKFRDEVLVPSMKDLGRIAITLADQFNTQHAQGFDLTGAAGGNFFSDAASLLRQPIANTENTGTEPTLTLDLGNSANLTSSDYELAFSGGSYTLTRLSDNSVVGTLPAAGGNLSFDGLDLTVSGGAPADGDRWTMRPTLFAAADLSVTLGSAQQIAAAGGVGVSNGAGDNSNALALAALQSGLSMSGGTSTFSGSYNQIISRNAIFAGSAETDVKTYTNLGDITRESQQSISGVSLDEEAARLIQYQQAYQAAARAIQISSKIIEEILAIR